MRIYAQPHLCECSSHVCAVMVEKGDTESGVETHREWKSETERAREREEEAESDFLLYNAIAAAASVYARGRRIWQKCINLHSMMAAKRKTFLFSQKCFVDVRLPHVTSRIIREYLYLRVHYLQSDRFCLFARKLPGKNFFTASLSSLSSSSFFLAPESFHFLPWKIGQFVCKRMYLIFGSAIANSYGESWKTSL